MGGREIKRKEMDVKRKGRVIEMEAVVNKSKEYRRREEKGLVMEMKEERTTEELLKRSVEGWKSRSLMTLW